MGVAAAGGLTRVLRLELGWSVEAGRPAVGTINRLVRDLLTELD